MADDLVTALEITAVGMGLVFAAILLLWGVMALLVRLTAEHKADADAEPVVDEHELKRRAAMAAVAVALAQDAGIQPHEFPLPPTAMVSAWQAVNRGRQLKQRSSIR